MSLLSKSKILFVISFLLVDLTFAKTQSLWNFQYSFNLKKDKIAKVYIKKTANKNKQKNSSYLLKFRWTLYENKNLILLSNYMGYPYQYVLKKESSLNSVKIKLLSSANAYNGRTYALIVFSDFNEKKQIATLNVYIKDDKKRISVKFEESQK